MLWQPILFFSSFFSLEKKNEPVVAESPDHPTPRPYYWEDHSKVNSEKRSIEKRLSY